MSLSARRAWIEINPLEALIILPKVALRKESVDRNYKERPGQKARPKSLSARRAWIEITAQTAKNTSIAVALRKESVDRNPNSIRRCLMSVVALRKESVDRNTLPENPMISVDVALRKESVDRNVRCSLIVDCTACRSPQGERG